MPSCRTIYATSQKSGDDDEPVAVPLRRLSELQVERFPVVAIVKSNSA
jgi:hypothetical protein